MSVPTSVWVVVLVLLEREQAMVRVSFPEREEWLLAMRLHKQSQGVRVIGLRSHLQTAVRPREMA